METESLGSEISLLNDEIASLIGVFLSLSDAKLFSFLNDIKTCQSYHMQMLSAVQSNDLIHQNDLDWIIEKYTDLRLSCPKIDGYMYPNGHLTSTVMHVIRTKTRELIRVIYQMERLEKRKMPLMIEFTNMLSNYYFYVAIKCNEHFGIKPDIYKTFDELLSKS
jgi:cob(I)alamin adenosyltransferase